MVLFLQDKDVGFVITTVEATDQDGNYVSYGFRVPGSGGEFVSNSDPFSINDVTGK